MLSDATRVRDFLEERREAFTSGLSEHMGDAMAAYANLYEHVGGDHYGRYPFELLQNAHDACIGQADRDGKAWFAWTETALLVADSGKGIDEAAAKALCTPGHSDKRTTEEEIKSIGRKGIGFVAAYELTDTPQFFNSHGTHFGFDLAEARERELPPGYLPTILRLQDACDDNSLCKRLFKEGARTIVRLPFKEGQARTESRSLFDEVLEPETLLFMPKLGSLHVWDGKDRREWTCKKTQRELGIDFLMFVGAAETVGIWRVGDGTVRRYWLLARTSTEAPDEVREHPGWGDTPRLEAAVAIPWHPTRASPKRDKPRRVCAFYATDEATGCELLFHGEFLTSTNRKDIQPAEEGNPTQLVQAMVLQMVEELARAVSDLGPKEAVVFLECLGKGEDASSAYGRELRQQVLWWLHDVELVPMRQSDGLQTPEDALGVDTCLDRRLLGKVLDLLKESSEFLDPEVVTADAEEVLLEINEDLSVDEVQVAQSVAPRGNDFEGVLTDLKAFVDGSDDEGQVAGALAVRPVVKAEDGQWWKPSEAHLPTDLPDAAATLLDVRVAATVRPGLRDFLERLGVKPLGVGPATSLLCELVEGESPPEHRLALEALRSLHESKPDQFEAALKGRQPDDSSLDGNPARSPIPMLELPTRNLDGNSGSRTLGEIVYFPATWGYGDLPERLYRRFQENEFLEEEPLEGEARKEQSSFFAALGVHKAPVVVNHENLYWTPRWHISAVAEERFGKYFNAGFDSIRCPNGHPQSGFSYELHVLDRLPQLLEDPAEESSLAIIELYGKSQPRRSLDRFQCHNSTHRGRNGVYHPEVSLEKQLLAEGEWVPFEGDYLAPNHFWKLPRGNNDLRLPKAPPGLDAVPGVHVADHYKPTSEQLTSSLALLEERHPSEVAQGVAYTADWLTERLARNRRPQQATVLGGYGRSLPVLAWRRGAREWASFLAFGADGLLWDLPAFADCSEGTDLLVVWDEEERDLTPLARQHSGLHQLHLASERLGVTPDFESPNDLEGYLGEGQLAATIALTPRPMQDYVAKALAAIEWHRGRGLCLTFHDENGEVLGRTHSAKAFLHLEHDPTFYELGPGNGAWEQLRPLATHFYLDDAANKEEQQTAIAEELVRLLPISERSGAEVQFQLMLTTPTTKWARKLSIDKVTLDEATALLESARRPTQAADPPEIHEEAAVTPAGKPAGGTETTPTGPTQGKDRPSKQQNPSPQGRAAPAGRGEAETGSEGVARQQGQPARGPSTTYPDPTAPIKRAEGKPTPRRARRRGEPPSGEGTSDGQGDSRDEAVNMEHEAASIETAKRVLKEEYGARVVDRSREKGWGYDLLCTIDGQEICVEVKSHSRSPQGFNLVESEFEKLGEETDSYWVVYVEGTTQDTHKVKVLRGLHDSSDDFEPVIKEYKVPLGLWERHVEEAFEVPAIPQGHP